MPSQRHPDTTLDRTLALLLFTGAVVYIWSLPHALRNADESYFLYEARRIAEGEVMYRDIFQFVTPGAPYIMALLFLVFGTTMATAVTAMAVLQGLTAVLVFSACRRLQVRPAFATIAALGHVAVCHSAWPVASWHWFSTTTLVLQCWVLARRPWPQTPTWALIPGAISGLAIGVQQQRGLPLAAGVMIVLTVDHVIGRFFGERVPWRTLLMRLAMYGCGIALILVPLLAPSLWLAGFDALMDAWVRFPLQRYGPAYGSAWGAVGWITRALAENTFPVWLRWSPLLLPVSAIRLIWSLMADGAPELARRQAMLLLLSATAILTIWYNADFIHIAFIAPLFLVIAAEALEAGVSMIGGRRPAFSVAATVCALLAATFGFKLLGNMRRAWSTYTFSHDTAFGRVDFATLWEADIVDAIRVLLHDNPSAELFCYPTLAGPYLTTGGRNPTPFQYADLRVLPPRDTERVMRILTDRQVQYILVAYALLQRDDPVSLMIKRDYSYHPIPMRGLKGMPTMLLYRRKPPVTNEEPAASPPKMF
jgi:hypothetical protein